MVKLEQDAIIGLAVGFGSIVGGIILCCILWNCCCGEKDKDKKPKSKRKPVGPWMEMCNGSSSDVSLKTSQTPISKRSQDSYSPKYDHRKQQQQKPLRAPFKQSGALNDDMYYDQSSPDYNYSDMYTEKYSQPTRPPYKQTRLPDMDYPAGSSAHQTHYNSSDWNDSLRTADNKNDRAINNSKKNPEAFYQRYLY